MKLEFKIESLWNNKESWDFILLPTMAINRGYRTEVQFVWLFWSVGVRRKIRIQ